MQPLVIKKEICHFENFYSLSGFDTGSYFNVFLSVSIVVY